MATHGSADRRKIVVRRLPPDLPEPAFLDSIRGPWSPHVTGVRFVCGKPAQKHKPLRHAHAFITFEQTPVGGAALLDFSRAYDGWLFRSARRPDAPEYRAVVEFAPHQRIAASEDSASSKVKQTKKKESRHRAGSLLTHVDYLRFVEALTRGEIDTEREYRRRDESGKKEQQDVAVNSAAVAPTGTPLLDFLRARKRGEKSKKGKGKPALAPVKILKSSSSKNKPPQESGVVVPAGSTSSVDAASKKAKKLEKQKEKQREKRKAAKAAKAGTTATTNDTVPAASGTIARPSGALQDAAPKSADAPLPTQTNVKDAVTTAANKKPRQRNKKKKGNEANTTTTSSATASATASSGSLALSSSSTVNVERATDTASNNTNPSGRGGNKGGRGGRSRGRGGRGGGRGASTAVAASAPSQ